jgi:hypothetical protein
MIRSSSKSRRVQPAPRTFNVRREAAVFFPHLYRPIAEKLVIALAKLHLRIK